MTAKISTVAVALILAAACTSNAPSLFSPSPTQASATPSSQPPTASSQTAAASPTIRDASAGAVLSWTVSPGSFANGVWTIPGTTTVTAAVLDESGNPITVGELVWQTCGGSGQDLGTHHPSADCEQKGSVRWRDAVILDPANPTPIHPCFCAGDQQGFRLTYRSKNKSTTGTPFDLFAESSCPLRSCP